MSMAHRYDIYIGSDNGSGASTDEYVDKIAEWANESFPDGYTMTFGRGYWHGKREDCVVLNALTDDEDAVVKRLRKLKGELKQDGILLSRYAVESEMV